MLLPSLLQKLSKLQIEHERLKNAQNNHFKKIAQLEADLIKKDQELLSKEEELNKCMTSKTTSLSWTQKVGKLLRLR